MKSGKGLPSWLEQRLPISGLIRRHLTGYQVPKNLNVWYVFGALALFVLCLQVLGGIFLAMHYLADGAVRPDSLQSGAFTAIQGIMRDVPAGWLIRTLHTSGASLLFVVLYLHILRGLLYGSYQKPRELVWILGCLLFFGMMAEAFLGYVLPWGQMSYWAAQVVTSLVASIPWVGPGLALMIRGDYMVSPATLTRFFALHVIAVPLLLAILVALHMIALRTTGSSNPDGLEPVPPNETLPFHPYYTSKDLLALVILLIVLAAIVFFAPTMGGYFIEPANLLPADPMHSPAEIMPMWYFSPFYAMLRAVPAIANSTFPGVLLVLVAITMWLLLPWLDRSTVRSVRYRSRLFCLMLLLLVLAFSALGVLGMLPLNPLRLGLAQCAIILYFVFFLSLPWVTRQEKPRKALPLSLTSTTGFQRWRFLLLCLLWCGAVLLFRLVV